MGAPEYRIVVRGIFEPVAYTLSTMKGIELLRHNADSVLFTVSSTTVALARPIGEGWACELLVLDPTGGMIASNLAELLRGQLGYEIIGPVRTIRQSPPAELQEVGGASPVTSG
jgi:hypothetical protein